MSRPPSRAWIARLEAARGRPEVRAASDPAVLADAVARLGAGPVRWAIAASADVVRRIIAEVPVLGGGSAAELEMLQRANELTTLRALTALAGGSPAPVPDGDVTLAGIREFVHRGVPLEQLLRGVRAGHAATTEAFLRACADLVDPAGAVEELAAVSSGLFSYVDGLTDAMVSTYLAEHDAWSTTAAAARAETVRALLADPASVDATTTTDVDQASKVLGYDLRRRHRAVVVWSDSAKGRPSLPAVARELLLARGATTTLVVPVASGRVSAWGTVPLRDGEHRSAMDTVAARLAGSEIHAAFGTSVGGVAGFRRSYREAERAERFDLVRRSAGAASVRSTDYADVAAIALLATDLEAAGEFVRRELGGLAASSQPVTALRGTLYHYLDAERSIAAVARRLHVARGTVTYRVHRAQELLGRDVGERRFALLAALTLAEDLGDAVLSTAGTEA